jgi:aspartate aminotransferase/aromatic-amino-acid transaminase
MIFSGIVPALADPILGLTAAWRQDSRPAKLNLGVGVFMDDAGRTPVLESVKRAERLLLDAETTKTYLPIAGTPAFADAVSALVFGPAFPAGRAAVLQTPGGTGALAAAAHLLAALRPDAAVYLPDPTWGNHKAIFAAAGLPVAPYPYLDPATRTVALDALCNALDRLPADAVVLLHACCHNPTGAEIPPDGWASIAAIAARRGWLPLVDFAYQGFGEGIAPDRAGLLALLSAVPEALVCSSFSKNMALYSERVGALSLVAADPDDAQAALTHARRVARTLWSNPPRHGAAIAETILSDDALRTLWLSEVDAMRTRIAGNRALIAEGLSSRLPDRDFSFLAAQRGMFSYLGLSTAQVARLHNEYAIYMVAGGRINVAGLPTARTDYLCDALAAIYRDTPAG